MLKYFWQFFAANSFFLRISTPSGIQSQCLPFKILSLATVRFCSSGFAPCASSLGSDLIMLSAWSWGFFCTCGASWISSSISLCAASPSSLSDWGPSAACFSSSLFTFFLLHSLQLLLPLFLFGRGFPISARIACHSLVQQPLGSWILYPSKTSTVAFLNFDSSIRGKPSMQVQPRSMAVSQNDEQALGKKLKPLKWLPRPMRVQKLSQHNKDTLLRTDTYIWLHCITPDCLVTLIRTWCLCSQKCQQHVIMTGCNLHLAKSKNKNLNPGMPKVRVSKI